MRLPTLRVRGIDRRRHRTVDPHGIRRHRDRIRIDTTSYPRIIR